MPSTLSSRGPLLEILQVDALPEAVEEDGGLLGVSAALPKLRRSQPVYYQLLDPTTLTVYGPTSTVRTLSVLAGCEPTMWTAIASLSFNQTTPSLLKPNRPSELSVPSRPVVRT